MAEDEGVPTRSRQRSLWWVCQDCGRAGREENVLGGRRGVLEVPVPACQVLHGRLHERRELATEEVLYQAARGAEFLRPLLVNLAFELEVEGAALVVM